MGKRFALVIGAAAAGVMALGAQTTAAAGQQLSCGDTITTDTTLHKNLLDCPNNGIVIGANGITLDLNGHTIDGDKAPGVTEFVGVDSDGHDGVTVKHGSVRDFAVGVGLGGAHNRLLGISARAEVIGFFLVQSSRILVRNCSGNRTTASDGAGLALHFSHHVRIVKSSFRHNAHIGVRILGSSGARILNSSLRHNAQIGIYTEDSNNTLIKGNVVSDSGDEGFLIQESEGIQITDNRVVRNGAGITLRRGSHNVIERNHVSHGHDGIRIEKGHGNLVARNIARGAGDDGFDVNYRTTKLTKNRAVRNGDLGIEAVRRVNDGGGNVARHNGDPRQCTHVACN